MYEKDAVPGSPSTLEESKDVSNFRQSNVKLRERDRIAAQKYIDTLEEEEVVSPPPFVFTSPSSTGESVSELSPMSASSYRPLSIRSPTNNRSQRTGSVRMKSNMESASTTVSGINVAGAERGNKNSSAKATSENIIQYGLWAHYLSYGAASMCICMGVFAVAWFLSLY